MKLYDYLDDHGNNVIAAWTGQQTRRDRAKIINKLRALEQMDFDLARGSKLLQGPIGKHVYKLKIHGEVMMRPLLCRGPIDNDNEYTLLIGAVEIGSVLTPTAAVRQAQAARETIIHDPNRRCGHVQVT